MLKKKLNILQVLPSLESGGVERGTIEIADFLVKKGHNSYVISSGGRLVGELIEKGTKHFLMDVGRKSIFTLLLIPKIIKLINKKKINIVHVRSRFPAWIIFFSLLFIKKNKRPFFITTVHGFNSISLYSKIMTKGDKIIVVSKFIEDFISSTYKVNKSKIYLIHRGVLKNLSPLNALDFNLWRKEFEKDFIQFKNKKILTISARVSRTKGIEIFIDLLKRVTKSRDDIHGIIVGEEKSEQYKSMLVKKIKGLNLEEKITFIGYRKDIYNVMQYSNITFCLSTIPEPFGRVVIESIKVGTPVIGFNYGGIGEQLREIFPEGLVENKNYQQLFNKTLDFLINHPKVKKTSKFSVEEMQNKTLNLYLDLYK
jgi:glycosyltransferase involved in cell wall biosynthesis